MGPSLDQDPGVIPRAVHQLFDSLDPANNPIVQIQFLEVYGEAIRDLLCSSTVIAKSKLTIRERQGEPTVMGATLQEVQNAPQALRILQQGLLRRVTGATAMNTASSRSHAIFSLQISQTIPHEDSELPPMQRRSKFHFVDLAGSERQKRTQASGQRLKEGIDINKGLLVLGNVISALSENKQFIPYRDSKLTRLLQGSLGGNHKTLMIACVSPSSLNLEESLNCLRYANRAKNIQNVAVVNVDPATQRLQALQNQVHSLAWELLRLNDGEEATIDRSELQIIVGAGESGNTASTVARGAPSSPAVTSSVQSPFSLSPAQRMSMGENQEELLDLRRQLHEAQHQLDQSQRELRQVRRYHEESEEQLYVTKAAKEMVDLQLSVATQGGTVAEPDHLGKAFTAKAAEYERKIGELQKQLQQAKTDALSALDTVDDIPLDQDFLKKAQAGLERDRARLSTLRATTGHDELESLFATDTPATPLSSTTIDKEEEIEREELDRLTSRYLEESISLNTKETDSSTSKEQSVLQADLIELSRSIAAKEDLIDQLKLSQEKYANMRDFYENKLEKMKVTLGRKETEREELLRQLAVAKEDEPASKDLSERLREKEVHIAALKRRQKELSDLTRVSSRNDSEITRLLSDVTEMKRKKVNLQKQLGAERKSHANELKRLRKDALQKDRQLNKQRKISNQREGEAQRATQLAKARLEELGLVRAKYKEAEKKMRLLSVRKGVMAKAGLDSVLVGRRSSNSRRPDARTSIPTPVGHRTRARVKTASADADTLRVYFDKKVADVARKECLVDKLAREWENHFELVSKKEALGSEKHDTKEIREDLDVKIKFKENRIRQLAQKLGREHKTRPVDSAASNASNDPFLFGKEFHQICDGADLVSSKEMASRVLFGMIVSEQRRVANLARAASSLDERLQVAEKRAIESEAALRTYMDEQRHEVVEMTQSQQEQILSLMDMVKRASTSDREDAVSEQNNDDGESSIQRTLLVLANQRIQVLESQLFALDTDAKAASTYRKQLEELRSASDVSVSEVEDLHDELNHLRKSLRLIRDLIDSSSEANDCMEQLQDIVQNVVSPTLSRHGKSQMKHSRKRVLESSNKYELEPAHTSDGEDLDDKEVDELASSIMADLALIAQGKVPPSLGDIEAKIPTELVDSSGVSGGKTHQDPSPISVFDRLANPVTFTGVQKQVLSQVRSESRGKAGSPEKKKRQEMSKQIADQLSKIVIPDDNETGSDTNNKISKKSGLSQAEKEIGDVSDSNRDYQDVFDRLISPSQYTGTQKEKFQQSKDKRARAADDVADRMLDDLLDSDSDEKAVDGSENSFIRSVTVEYTRQDVFERLQKTTTQSYAVKHNGLEATPAVAGDATVSVPTEPFSSPDRISTSKEHSPPVSPEDTVDGDTVSQNQYATQNVFERLQKTTTEAYKAKREL